MIKELTKDQWEKIKYSDQLKIVEKYFKYLGYKVLYKIEKYQAAGADMIVCKNNKKPLSVEIKTIRKCNSGTINCGPVSKNRKKDDLIAIIINKKYVLIEPMKDHLRCCSEKGTRQFTILI